MMATSYEDIAALVREGQGVVVATVVRPENLLGRRGVLAGGDLVQSLGDASLDQTLRDQAPAMLRSGLSKTLKAKDQSGQEADLFCDVYPVPPTLHIFGGVHVAIPLTKLGKMMGFRVIVIDPRGVFATRERFADADELCIAHPQDYLDRTRIDENSYVAVLTHDPKHDEPILKHVVGTGASYIGAIGSRKTNMERNARLAAQGVTEAQLARVHAPIGLDIGSQSPEEVALAIIAEIVAARYGKQGRPLVDMARAAS